MEDNMDVVIVAPATNPTKKQSTVDEIIGKLKNIMDCQLHETAKTICEEVNNHSLTKQNLAQTQEKLCIQQQIVDKQSEKINSQQQTIDQQGCKIHSQQKQINEQEKQINSQQQTIDQQGCEIHLQQKQINEQEKQINSQQQTIDQQGCEMHLQKKQVDEQEKQINLQNNKLEDLFKKITELEQTQQLVDHNNYWKMLKVVAMSAVITTIIHNYLK